MWSRSKTPRFERAGFTLVEVLLALALTGVVALALYGNIAAAVRIWRTSQRELPDEERLIFFQKAGADFHQVLRYKELPFEGDGESVKFPALVALEPKLGGDRGIGEVRYFYDPSERAIVREVRSFSDVFRERDGKRELLQRNVHGLRLSYFMREEPFGDYGWVDAWDPEEAQGALPLAVRMDYESYERDAYVPYSRTFLIPVGGPALASS
jgi:prepilin-type N-terminal cleavage/methylation domain-containing protein